jgi:S1-C subfamily serine protease
VRLSRFALPACIALGCPAPANAADLADVVARVKPSIVGVGFAAGAPGLQKRLAGTGFVVGDGTLVVTNAHVVQRANKAAKKYALVVFVGRGTAAEARPAQVRKVDEDHDLTLLELTGTPLPALAIGDSSKVREGSSVAFTGFPIGAVLGLYPVTHTGTVSAITPIVQPAASGRDLDATDIRLLRTPYDVFQLDATAYPGNSGSPVYDPATGKVIAIVSQVFVKGRKEDVLRNPSAISYAMPARYIQDLLR